MQGFNAHLKNYKMKPQYGGKFLGELFVSLQKKKLSPIDRC
jgi:hypothetical protein